MVRLRQLPYSMLATQCNQIIVLIYLAGSLILIFSKCETFLEQYDNKHWPMYNVVLYGKVLLVEYQTKSVYITTSHQRHITTSHQTKSTYITVIHVLTPHATSHPFNLTLIRTSNHFNCTPITTSHHFESYLHYTLINLTCNQSSLQPYTYHNQQSFQLHTHHNQSSFEP